MNRTVARLLLAGLLLACAACGKSGAQQAAGRYLTEPAAIGDVQNTVLSAGVLQPLEVINVGAQATGQIQSLKVQLGDVVRKGQLLAVIDPAIQLNTLQNAQAALAAQQGRQAMDVATLRKAELDLSRSKSLMDQGYAAKAAYDQAAAQVAIARAAAATSAAVVSQTRIAVDKAKVDLGRTNIIAPIDGVVAAILVREGQTVNAVQMAPTLLRLAKMDVMTVRAQVSEADVINVHPGQTVYFTILGDADRRYYARLRSVEPAPDSAGDTLTAPANTAIYYNALFDVPNTDGRLRSSMTAQVNIVLGEAKGVLTGPAGALGKRGADGFYRVKVLNADGTTAERKVKAGVIDNARFQVLSGLARGDKVVVGDAWNAKVSGVIKPEDK
jgi:macrolide-specific efflux system membrane fusion protein